MGWWPFKGKPKKPAHEPAGPRKRSELVEVCAATPAPPWAWRLPQPNWTLPRVPGEVAGDMAWWWWFASRCSN